MRLFCIDLYLCSFVVAGETMSRPRFLLFGDSITEQGFRNGGWAAALAETYSRKVSSPFPSFSVLNLQFFYPNFVEKFFFYFYFYFFVVFFRGRLSWAQCLILFCRLMCLWEVTVGITLAGPCSCWMSSFLRLDSVQNDLFCF